MKPLIAFYSRAGGNYFGGRIVDVDVGNTEIVADKLCELTGGERFKIEPVKPYSDDYRTCVKEASADLKADARPALKHTLPRIDADTIILCYPNFCGTMPMPVWTFLTSHDLGGKTILPLCTNEGSGMGASERDLRRLCPDATLGSGLSVRGGDAKQCDAALRAWLTQHAIL